MQRSSSRILSYKIKHDYDVSEFLSSYRCLLRRAIDVIWESIEWHKRDMARRQLRIYSPRMMLTTQLSRILTTNVEVFSHNL